MANPFGYGDSLGFSRTQLSETGLFPTVWLQEALRLEMPGVYFPMVTPFETSLEERAGQNVVVPLEGEMVDSSWPTLSEGTSITVGSYNADAFTVLLKEAGRGLAVERLVKQYIGAGLYPGAAEKFVGKLARNFVLSWENQLRSIYLNTQWGFYSVASGSMSSIKRDEAGTGLFSITGSMRTTYMDLVLRELRQVKTGSLGTFIVGPYDDGLYRLVGNWNTIGYLTKEPDFVSLETRNQQRGGRGMIYQEIGEWNGFKIVNHALMPDGTSIAHGRNVAIQAFGGQFEDDDIDPRDITRIEDPVPFQIRYERNWKGDFNRAKAAAWYTVAGSSAALRDLATACIRIHTQTGV
jgi:hypothetical protein